MDKVWNPLVNGYVDKQTYEDALKTKDPTQEGYKGTKPNFGGGTTDPNDGPGSGPKKMRKLTTVLSKNQKLYSMNVPEITAKFEHKLNINNEFKREELRRTREAKNQFIDEHLPQIEAIQEAKKISAYLQTEEQTNQFVQAAVNLKLE